MIWTPDQDKALVETEAWFKAYKKNPKNTPQIKRIFGWAGTGKSTLAMHFAAHINGEVAFATFTGKAAIVLQSKGALNATTIHSLMYIPEVDEKTGKVTFRWNNDSPLRSAAMIVIDECSMVDEPIALDLLRYKKPILVLGDPFQLPPPDGCGYFTEAEPDIMLRDIHRQSADNPVIYLATKVRNNEELEYGYYGDSKIVKKASMDMLLDADQIIVGKNDTRLDINSKYRDAMKIDSIYPKVGERLIGLQNDKNNSGILNGEMFDVQDVKFYPKTPFFVNIKAKSLDRKLVANLKVHKSKFDSDMATPEWKALRGSQDVFFGYAITAHKSQGSAYKNPFILDESYAFREYRNRWIYTAITRTVENFTLYRK